MDPEQYEQYAHHHHNHDCGCKKPKEEKECKDKCPKVPKDCYGKFCLPCLSCTFPEVYAEVVCCVNKVIANIGRNFSEILPTLPVNGEPGAVTRATFIARNQLVIKTILETRDQAFAYLEKACCCLKGDGKKDCHSKDKKDCYNKEWSQGKDACQKEAIVKAMADIICCGFQAAGSYSQDILNSAATIPVGLEEDEFAQLVLQIQTALEPQQEDGQARLAELLRCLCGTPPVKVVKCIEEWVCPEECGDNKKHQPHRRRHD